MPHVDSFEEAVLQVAKDLWPKGRERFERLGHHGWEVELQKALHQAYSPEAPWLTLNMTAVALAVSPTQLVRWQQDMSRAQGLPAPPDPSVVMVDTEEEAAAFAKVPASTKRADRPRPIVVRGPRYYLGTLLKYKPQILDDDPEQQRLIAALKAGKRGKHRAYFEIYHAREYQKSQPPFVFRSSNADHKWLQALLAAEGLPARPLQPGERLPYSALKMMTQPFPWATDATDAIDASLVLHGTSERLRATLDAGGDLIWLTWDEALTAHDWASQDEREKHRVAYGRLLQWCVDDEQARVARAIELDYAGGAQSALIDTVEDAPEPLPRPPRKTM